jgi:hypothetical protein
MRQLEISIGYSLCRLTTAITVIEGETMIHRIENITLQGRVYEYALAL